MAIPRPYKILAEKLQEADRLEISNEDVRSALNDCLRDEYPEGYCYVCHVFGDAESGDVAYYCNGQYYMAPYEVGMANGKRTHDIDFADAKNVLPRTVYDQEADEEDQDAEMYGGMTEAERAESYVERFPGSAQWKRPILERYISKKTRDSMSDSDFAGSGKSFPIQKASDVMAAVRSIGRGVAGGQSAASLKRRIIAIAKRKGYASSLPTSWQASDTNESKDWAPSGVLLVEAATFGDRLPEFREAAAQYPIKLMSPGRGSSGYYTESVLKTAATNKVFPKGTLMFWNHDTDQEEAARPEGDLARLAGVTTSDAVWNEEGRDGPGLYAQSKVFSDYVDQVKEKGPHIGLSIRAGGDRDESAKGPDGKPRVITALRNAYSVDFVTKAGRDGKIFTEAATAPETTEGDNMDEAKIQALIKEAVSAAVAPLVADNQKLKETIALQKAPGIITEALRGLRLPDASKRKIHEKFTSEAVISMLPMKDGQPDSAEISKMVEAEAKREAAFLMELGFTGSAIASVGAPVSEADRKTADENHKTEFAEAMNNLADMFVGPEDKSNENRAKARVAFINGRAA